MFTQTSTKLWPKTKVKIREKLTYKNEFILHLIIAVRLY